MAYSTQTLAKPGGFSVRRFLAGMIVVVMVAFTTPIAFLWHNLIGAVAVFVVGMAISLVDPRQAAARPAAATGRP